VEERKIDMDLQVKIGNVIFKNPIWVASGTFGYGEEFLDFLDLDRIGAVVTKTVTLKALEGNIPPRLVETPSGLLNSIGLENKGIDHFKAEHYPFLKKLKTKIVVSIGGSKKEEFERCVEKLSGEEAPDAIELNLSCPNVAHAGTRYSLISQDVRATEKIVSSCRKKTGCVIIAKLTPSVTDIAAVARAAEIGGADAVSVINTCPGMAVDAEEMRPLLGNVTGGLSGPAIKPIALKAVWDVYHKVKIPVVGVGGVMTGIDVAEFMLCGARAVQIGTANLADPVAYDRILDQFKKYLKQKKIKRAGSLAGKLKG
jgi:dihydroorotate dehydrogenase (NAD+) catalytic subunit